jgi:hypothetical protein
MVHSMVGLRPLLVHTKHPWSRGDFESQPRRGYDETCFEGLTDTIFRASGE